MPASFAAVYGVVRGRFARQASIRSSEGRDNGWTQFSNKSNSRRIASHMRRFIKYAEGEDRRALRYSLSPEGLKETLLSLPAGITFTLGWLGGMSFLSALMLALFVEVIVLMLIVTWPRQTAQAPPDQRICIACNERMRGEDGDTTWRCANCIRKAFENAKQQT
jgi:hypothetical protein